MTSPDPEDPGWLSGKSLLEAVFPIFAVRRRPDGDVNILQVTRQLFTAFALALVLIGLVVLVLAGDADPDPGGPDTGLVAAGVVAYGLLSLLLPGRLAPSLDCSSDVSLITTYRSRFFVRIAFADSAAIIGFTGFLLSGRSWMYPLGGVFAAIGFVRLAPTGGNLQRDQEALTGQGCGRLLLPALTSTHPSGPEDT